MSGLQRRSSSRRLLLLFGGLAVFLFQTTIFVSFLVGSAPGSLRLRLRTRVQPFKGSGRWEEVYFFKEIPPGETAIVICDMWDKHWCKGATERVDALAHRMSPLLKLARARGVQIVHAPSDVMDFYKDYPQRRLMQSLPKVQPPQALDLSDPPLPIDDSDGGCDTPGDKEHKAWSRQNPAIDIEPQDVISDDGSEVYSFFHERGIKYLFIMGVHTNMCVLGRSFAIRQMTRWGINCILIRDLTDAMYNPAMKPYVSHEQGTHLVIEHIEKYWCPSILSADLKTALTP